jgi:hypothetical protein
LIIKKGNAVKTIRLVDTECESTVDELRTHYMSLLAHHLIAIMKNTHQIEAICSIKFVHPHMSMIKRLFKIVDSDGKDLSQEVFEFIEKSHQELIKEGVLA